MKAKLQKWCGGGERRMLKDLVPLDTPISLIVEPSSFCNFKCRYCLRSLSQRDVYESNIMSLKIFQKIIDDVKKFPQKISAIILAGMGEPLINKNLPQMIKYVKQMDVCNTVKVISNGSLLSEEMSLALIDAGLDVLRISLQGMNAEKVREVCGYELDYKKFLSNIEFFYNNRRQCKLYIRILDEHISDKNEFYETYGNICDEMYVEHLIDFEKDNTGEAVVKNTMQEEVAPVEVCSYPFYQLVVAADGKLYPCCVMPDVKGASIGHVNDVDLSEFWNGKCFSGFRYDYLMGQAKICSQCKKAYERILQKEDNIDCCRDKLIDYYKELKFRS